MIKRTLFVTGTDTDCGKTYISVALLNHFSKKGYRTLGLKPIASGCNPENDDALQLQKASSIKLPYSLINPYALHQPIAPHIAASIMGISLSVTELIEKTALALSTQADICIVEGAGGWLLPLNNTETYADYVLQQDMEIILIINMRLGCINHALLTCQSILSAQGKLIGWIANTPKTIMAHFEENIETLKQWLPVPHLGTVMPHEDAIDIFL